MRQHPSKSTRHARDPRPQAHPQWSSSWARSSARSRSPRRSAATPTGTATVTVTRRRASAGGGGRPRRSLRAGALRPRRERQPERQRRGQRCSGSRRRCRRSRRARSSRRSPSPQSASDLDSPLFLSGAPGDRARLYIVEKPGRIRIRTKRRRARAGLPRHHRAHEQGGEQGLLGLAFHPAYATNGRFYVDYTRHRRRHGRRQYDPERRAIPTLAEPTALRVLRTIGQPFDNHNGGMLARSAPTAFSTWRSATAAAAAIRKATARTGRSKLGKILRLDVDADTPPPATSPAPIPASGTSASAIPFRFSFDRATGDLYIGDVGPGRLRGGRRRAARQQGGTNYGWNVTEGLRVLPAAAPACDHDRHHVPGRRLLRTTTGGLLGDRRLRPPRQRRSRALVGRYLYGDLCTRRIRSFVWNGSAAVSEVELTARPRLRCDHLLAGRRSARISTASSTSRHRAGRCSASTRGDGARPRSAPGVQGAAAARSPRDDRTPGNKFALRSQPGCNSDASAAPWPQVPRELDSHRP